ncbi:MAG: hypothetical protein COX48_04075 [bacterium (Candidatus Stahlbacteria) CG23_combo_of_CG06-09_8_20_14_all_34_7]|nr:MAG: hypothetical protein COX48_04075 [bacterium (Candidatus Stahlbacteria) CG23_combo_of_CG06-09_8_20_14_all_34_7]
MIKKFIFILISVIFIMGNERVKISYNDFQIVKESIRDLDIVGYKIDEFVELNINSIQKQKVSNLKVKMISIMHKSSKGEYLSLSGYYEKIDSLAIQYSAICDLETLGYTFNGNPLVIMKINGVNPSVYAKQTSFLLMAEHHAREWQTTPLAIFFAESLLMSYSADSVAKKIIDNSFIVVYPLVNPDGYYYSHDDPSGDNYWRKNRTYRMGYYGVDLNRNYEGGCNRNLASDWGYPSGISLNPSETYIYAGPYPASEQETKSVKQIISQYDFNISISLHSYAEDLLYPWGSIYEATPDDSVIISVAEKIAGEMRKNDGFNTYDYIRSADLYPTTGDSDDWIYGWSKRLKGKTTVPFTLEVDVTFQPNESTLDSLYRRIYPGLLKAALLCDTIKGKLNEMPLKPDLYLYGMNLFWSSINTHEAEHYTLYMEKNPVYITDLYNDTSKYNLTNVSLDSVDYYSSSASFHPLNINTSASIIKLKDKIKVKSGDSLMFYLKYDIETNNDYMFVEASEDDNLYTPLDTTKIYTGADNDWRKQVISLENWANKEIYIRFRTLFDGLNLNSGVYIDDIYPIADSSFKTLYAENITDTFIEISIDPYSGDNFVSVLPYNTLFGNTVLSDRYQVNIAGENPSIKDSTQLNEIKIYFNAKNRSLDIKYYSNASKDLKIFIYRIDGVLLLEESANVSRNYSMDISFLRSGKYFVRVEGERTATQGFVLLK